MRSSARIAAMILLLAGVAHASLGGYVAEIEKWREKFDDDVRHGGWLNMVGRTKIEEGPSTLGSDAASMLVLPPKAPAQFGTLIRQGVSFQFTPAPGVEATVATQAVSGSIDLPTKRGSARLQSGDLTFAVRAIGEDFYLLVDDANNPAVQQFKGTTWYPIQPSYRVAAKFVPYARPLSVHVPMTHVESQIVQRSSGDLVFRLGGKSYRLQTFDEDDGSLFVMFQDQTNGHGTYGGGRFVDVPKPTDGVAALDFNKAFNPYCSVNSYVTCPIPPAQNRIDVKVTAGETFFGE
jgi:uncharacterized protein